MPAWRIRKVRGIEIFDHLTRSCRAEARKFCDESVVAAASVDSLEGAGRGGKSTGRGEARDVGVAAAVHRNGRTLIDAAPAQISGVNDGRAERIELGHETVQECAAENTLGGAGSGGKVAGRG